MKYLSTIASVGVICVVVFSPSVVDAQLVTCAGTEAAGGECNFCTFAQMIERIVDFLVMILILISVIMLAVTGIQMAYTAAGNGDALSLLKDRMTNIVIGFFLIIASWTLVDTLIKVLVSNTSENAPVMSWRTFGQDVSELCGTQIVPEEKQFFVREGADATDPTFEGGAGVPDVDPDGDANEFTGSEALALLGAGEFAGKFTVVSSGGCSDRTKSNCTSLDGINQTTIIRVRQLQQAFGEPLVITGGTEVGHSNKYACSHGSGCKLDLRSEPKFDSYVESNFEKIGDSKWRDSNGNVYYRHGNKGADGVHWDVSFLN